MLKDIPIQKVKDIAIAITPRENNYEDDISLWDTYLINLKEEKIRFVLVNAKSYGNEARIAQKTTTFRYYIDEILPQTAIKIEPIQTTLFDLTTEYWLSFLHNEFLYDKKYIFVRGSIDRQHFTQIPFLNKKGVMIK